jgi:hypothetical protein
VATWHASPNLVAYSCMRPLAMPLLLSVLTLAHTAAAAEPQVKLPSRDTDCEVAVFFCPRQLPMGFQLIPLPHLAL